MRCAGLSASAELLICEAEEKVLVIVSHYDILLSSLTRLFPCWAHIRPNTERSAFQENGDCLSIICFHQWGTGVRGLMRSLATLPEVQQEPFVMKSRMENSPRGPGGALLLYIYCWGLHQVSRSSECEACS